MSTEQFSNNAATTLANAMNSSQTTLTVNDASLFPASAQFRIRIDSTGGSEIVLVTGGAGTTTWTVQRGIEGTTAISHASGDTVTEVLTAGAMAQFQQDTLARVWNYLFNGGFDFAQRQAPATLTAYANGSNGPDRWYLLGNSGATDIQFARVDETANGLNSRYSGQVKNNNGAAKYTGIAQIIESVNSVPLRGRTVLFQVRVKTSTASRNMRCAILEWTGTADAVAFGGGVGRDPVSNWASTNYTAGNFFRNTSLTVVGVSASTTPGTSYTDLTVYGNVDTSCNNLVCMIWEESATPAGATWNLMQAGLFDGTNLLAWLPRPLQQELALCQRYYEKTYDPDTNPGTVTTNGALESPSTVNASGGAPVQWPYKVEKRSASPTIVIYSRNSGTSGKCYDVTGNADVNAASALSGMSGVQLNNSAAITVGHFVDFHATADCDL
jgi:hypothetical protein